MIAIMSTHCIDRLLQLTNGDVRIADGGAVFRAGEPVRSMFVVRRGAVRLLRHRPDGAALVLHRARDGELLAEASLFSSRYHCDALADGDTVLARIPRAEVLALQREDAGSCFEFAAMLARELQRARARAELLSLKRVDERVDAWLELNGGALPERGRWVAVAAEIGVSPEALYRELARRRRTVPAGR